MFDVPGKGQRGTHGFGIGLHIRLVGFGKPLAKSRPAAHNLDGIVKVQFVPAVSDAGLQGLIDVLFIHRNDQHLVIRKQVTPHRLIKAQAMEQRPELLGIVHGKDFRSAFLCFLFAGFGIDARRCRHVQPLVAPDKGVVMHLDESGMVFTLRRIPCRAMRLITDNQIKREARRRLCLMHHVNGLVGRKNDGQSRAVLRRFKGLCQLVRIGGGRIGHFLNPHIFFITACLGIRTDGKTAQGNIRIRRPCPQGLGKQRNGRNQKQHRTTGLHHLLCDDKGGVRLARAASHDELAPVVRLKPLQNGFQSLLLMRARRLLHGTAFQLVRLVQRKGRPVNGSLFKVFQRNERSRDSLAFQRIGGVFGEGSRGNDNPLGEASLARQRKEVPEIAHGNRGIIKLTLDGAVGFPFPELRHKVDSGIRKRIALFLALWPILPEPYPGKKILILRIGLQIGAYQPFKGVSLVPIVFLFPILLQKLA